MLRHQRIALDFDDVLFESSHAFWLYCRGRGCGIADWRSAQNNLRHLMACDNQEQARQIIADWTDGPWQALHDQPPSRACIEALTKLCNAGAHLLIVTARNPKDAELTQGYVDRFLGAWIRAVYFSTDKARTCLELGCTVLIDDSPQQLTAVAERGIEAVAFGKVPWMERVQFPRCNSWAKLVDWLMVQVQVVNDPDICDCLLRAGVSAINVDEPDGRVDLWLRKQPEHPDENVILCTKRAFRTWPRSQVIALFKPATIRWR